MIEHLLDAWRLVLMSLRLIAGRRYFIAPLLVLLWPAFEAFRLQVGWLTESFRPVDVQGGLIGLPLVVLAVGLGVRIIAGEMDRRTIEIAYTVPGGSERVWLAKLGAAVLLLISAEALLAVAAWTFFTSFPLSALYGAMQAALFYLVLAMALAALLRSEVTAAMAVAAVLALNGLITGFGHNQVRISPFWNAAAVHDTDPTDLLAFTVQNRIGFALAIVALVIMACARAERREKLLGG